MYDRKKDSRYGYGYGGYYGKYYDAAYGDAPMTGSSEAKDGDSDESAEKPD
ncbi:MAG: hypothetical protein J6Y43_07280 [Clostridia bacterium]|nr:hypothetical protein [Clostridia bacterium]